MRPRRGTCRRSSAGRTSATPFREPPGQAGSVSSAPEDGPARGESPRGIRRFFPGATPRLMRYAFAEFALDTAARQLLRADEAVHLEPKALELLELLLLRRPEAVSKSEI